MKLPKNRQLIEVASGSYAVPKNIYGLLNALQLSKDLDNQERISQLIRSRHNENPILRYDGKKWRRADLNKI